MPQTSKTQKTETPVVCFKDKDGRKQAGANSG
jgi:hypothetical protein